MATDEYDFVIIGGGTSGLVVANRLSEDPNVQVLVLEAGENHLNDPRVMIPALCMSLQGSEADWNFATTPQV
jgi:choline dehydrogenase-like flavoprotein